MRCQKCNSEITEKFCPFCGEKNPNSSTETIGQQPSPVSHSHPPNTMGVSSQTKIKELEKKIEDYLIYGIICLFVFWPIAIYFFYVRSNDQQELRRLKEGASTNGTSPPTPPPSYT
jgi:hypothetical protein